MYMCSFRMENKQCLVSLLFLGIKLMTYIILNYSNLKRF
jgi:hypothetical protein